MSFELEQSEKSKDIDKYLEFTLGKENYVMPLLKVREVIAIPKTTPIPHAPKHFVGIMNLRGQVISIIDMRTQFSIVGEESSKEKAVVIVDMNPVYIGIVVDSVNTVVSIPEDLISAPPELNSARSSNYIQGVYRKDKEMALVIDIGAALGVKDLEIIKQQAA